MRVVWELDNWKKNEEAKFKIELKQREIEYMNRIVEKWNNYENEREKKLKTHELNFESIEAKLKSKMIELQKRENKIALFESEMHTKLAGIANEIVIKNREIEKIKSDNELEIQKLTKTNKELERKVKRLEEQIEQKNQTFKTLKEEIENHPVNQLKSELEEKQANIRKLNADINKYEELKNEYKRYTTQLQKENEQLRKECETLKSQTNKELIKEINRLKLNIFDIGYNEKATNLSEIKKEFQVLKDQRLQDNNPQRLENSNMNKRPIISNSEVSRLMQERDFLINLGLDDNDQMIKNLDMEISKFDFQNN